MVNTLTYYTLVLHIKECSQYTSGAEFYLSHCECLKCTKMPKVPKIKEYCLFYLDSPVPISVKGRQQIQHGI